VGKAKRIFGWEPRVPLAEGLRKIVETRLTPPSGVQEAANG
jgi:nucleoside-diphosphate-sugar epimerase